MTNFSLEVVMDGVMYKYVEKEVNKVVFLGAGNCIFDGKF